jgi:hypothetical protein
MTTEAPVLEKPRVIPTLPANKLWVSTQTCVPRMGAIEHPDVSKEDFCDQEFVCTYLQPHTSGPQALRKYEEIRLVAEGRFMVKAIVADVAVGFVRLAGVEFIDLPRLRDATDFALPPGFRYEQDWTRGTWTVFREKDNVPIVTERTKMDALRELLNHASVREPMQRQQEKTA